MKINVGYLRLGLLILNLVCVFSLPAFAFYRYKASDIPRMNIVNTALFEYKESDEVGNGPKSELGMVIAAEWFQPRRPSPEFTLPQPDELASETAAARSGVLEPGPLDKDWEYYSGFFFEDHPLRNRVLLRRKDPDLRPRTTLRPIRVNPAKKGAALPHQSTDTIAFAVREREYLNTELDLHIRIHSADAEHMVYSMPNDFKKGQPPTKFALKRVVEIDYIKDPKGGLHPVAPPEAAAAEGTEARKERPKIIIRTKDFDDTKEGDFERYERGEEPFIAEEPSGHPRPGQAGGNP